MKVFSIERYDVGDGGKTLGLYFFSFCILGIMAYGPSVGIIIMNIPITWNDKD